MNNSGLHKYHYRLLCCNAVFGTAINKVLEYQSSHIILSQHYQITDGNRALAMILRTRVNELKRIDVASYPGNRIKLYDPNRSIKQNVDIKQFDITLSSAILKRIPDFYTFQKRNGTCIHQSHSGDNPVDDICCPKCKICRRCWDSPNSPIPVCKTFGINEPLDEILKLRNICSHWGKTEFDEFQLGNIQLLNCTTFQDLSNKIMGHLDACINYFSDITYFPNSDPQSAQFNINNRDELQQLMITALNKPIEEVEILFKQATATIINSVDVLIQEVNKLQVRAVRINKIRFKVNLKKMKFQKTDCFHSKRFSDTHVDSNVGEMVRTVIKKSMARIVGEQDPLNCSVNQGDAESKTTFLKDIFDMQIEFNPNEEQQIPRYYSNQDDSESKKLRIEMTDLIQKELEKKMRVKVKVEIKGWIIDSLIIKMALKRESGEWTYVEKRKAIEDISLCKLNIPACMQLKSIKAICQIQPADQYEFEAVITDEKLYEKLVLHLPNILADIKDNLPGAEITSPEEDNTRNIEGKCAAGEQEDTEQDSGDQKEALALEMKTYSIDPLYAGVVIGKQGKTIEELRKIPGVFNIKFDTKLPTPSLQVIGNSEAACETVFNEIKARIDWKQRADMRPLMQYIIEVNKIFIDVNDISLDNIELVPFGSIERKESVILRPNINKSYGRLIVSSFTPNSMFDENIQETSKTSSNISGDSYSTKRSMKFMEFSIDNISASFTEALNVHQRTPNEKITFTLSPGKVIFKGPIISNCYLLRSEITSSHGSEYIKSKKLDPFFTPNLNPEWIPLINKRLDELGFEVLNADSPENYTTVNLYIGAKKSFFSVVLALDENLESSKMQKDDPRLSEEKKKSIMMILDAKTIGEVIPNEPTVRMCYYKKSKLVHPDKNSHPGAIEAYKKLNDAYQHLSTGHDPSKEALIVENNKANDTPKLPPKVVKVKTKKIKMCVLTTLSANDLDVRATMLGYEEDKYNLSEQVTQTLNMCWDQRDSTGRIPTPEGGSQIVITYIKQVLEAYDWVKDVQYSSGGTETAILEIKIKKMREKASKDENWTDCVEIDFELNYDSSDRNHLLADALAREMIEIKQWIERIFVDLRLNK